MIARLKGLPAKAIKCMALVESHPLAYQMEEFRLESFATISWAKSWPLDYMASLIDFNLANSGMGAAGSQYHFRTTWPSFRI